MKSVAKSDNRARANQRGQSSAGLEKGSTTPEQFRVTPSPVARLFPVWQRHRAVIRTDHSAPEMAGQPLNGMHRLDPAPGRCHNFFPVRASVFAWVCTVLAAARELSARPTRTKPRISSVLYEDDRRKILPSPILSGGGTTWPGSCATQASLCPTRTPPLLGNHHSFRRTHTTLPGATGVDSSTGAAVQRPVALGRLE